MNYFLTTDTDAMAYDKQVSSIDLGLPLEAQVLSQFFDPEFIPSDYINALFMTSLSNGTNLQLNNKSNELYSASSLKMLFKRCSALSLHFNEYTNELAKRFDRSYEKLYTSSTQIISYDNSRRIDIEEGAVDGDDAKEIVTRLQYYLATLDTSMYSLLDDLKHTRSKLDTIDPSKSEDSKPIEELQTLVLVKSRIEEVKSAFGLLKSLVASSEIEDSNGELNNAKTYQNDTISVSEFKNALAVLHNLMQDQISQEIELVHATNAAKGKIEVNKKLVKIVDNMINLQPIFKSFVNFQASYAVFVEFLREQKDNYLNLFEE